MRRMVVPIGLDGVTPQRGFPPSFWHVLVAKIGGAVIYCRGELTFICNLDQVARMTESRTAQLQDFVDALHTAFASAIDLKPEGKHFVQCLFGALQTQHPCGPGVSALLPVCAHLAKAVQPLRSSLTNAASLAGAFQAIAPELEWKRRTTGGPLSSDNWWDGHPNAVVIGEGGLEQRNDVVVGVSLMAPQGALSRSHPPARRTLYGLDCRAVSAWR
jgi:hypothetical protein